MKITEEQEIHILNERTKHTLLLINHAGRVIKKNRTDSDQARW